MLFLNRYYIIAYLSVFCTVSLPCLGHFQALLPSAAIVSAGDDKTVHFDVRFTHPMACGPVMNMAPPVRFGVVIAGRRIDLLSTLTPRLVEGRSAYAASYGIGRPGDCVFFLEPAPYWEPAEGKMIVHYTKVVVSAYGEEEGWDVP